MSLGATELRGTIAVTPIAALRRGLYSFGVGVCRISSTPLPTRSLSPPFLDRVGLQYVHGYIASISKTSKVRPINIFTLHRECLIAFFHNLFPVRSCRCCNQCSNKGKVNCALKTGKIAR